MWDMLLHLTTHRTIEVGGAMLTPESIASPPAEKKLTGSVMIFKAESLEAVRKMIESDIYWTSDVVRSPLSCMLYPALI